MVGISSAVGGNYEQLNTTDTLTVTVNPISHLYVGSMVDDNANSSTPWILPGNGTGAITGGGAADVLIGDPGGSTLVAGQTANIVFVLDTSGSMSTSIPFTDGSATSEARIAALIHSTQQSLTDLHSSGAHVLTHIVTFNTNASDLGTYDLSVDAQYNSAMAAVKALTANGNTNYEAALQHVETWIASTGTGSPLDNANINKVLFVSDGAPNTAIDNSGNVTGSGSLTAATAMQHVLGTYNPTGTANDDTHNEVTGIENSASHGDHFTIESVGINVSSSALSILSQVEGVGGSADNITTAAGLSTVVGNVLGSHVSQSAAGSDTINGGAGNDLIFGDAPNTDALAVANHLTTPAGSGWLVFQQLGWSVDTIKTYIEANHLSLSAESGRTGGNDIINGGAGDDIIYGQEGNDTISGGTGNNTLIGGSGADTFKVGAGNDVIKDFTVGTDKIIIEPAHTDVLFQHSAGTTTAHLTVTNNGATVGSVTLEGINDSNASLLATLLHNGDPTIHS